MKDFRIKKIIFRNWKGIDFRETEFSEETTISGDNETGKTRHFDAYLWLLFGIDSQGRLNSGIRTLENGALSFDGECSVEGVFSINKREIILKRELRPKFNKAKGEVEKIYNGETTVTYFNSVKKSITEYNEIINDIIYVDIFKILSDPMYFERLNWNKRRAILFSSLATDIEIDDPKFDKLKENLYSQDLNDYRKSLKSEIRQKDKKLVELSAKIEQVKSMTPEVVDFSSIKKKITLLEQELSTILSEKDTKSLEIVKLEAELENRLIILNKKDEANKTLFYEDLNKLRRKKRELEYEIETLKSDVEKRKLDKSYILKQIERKNDWLNTLRENWSKENAEEYQEEKNCPFCGEKLKKDFLLKAKEVFDKNKKNVLDDILKEGEKESKELNKLCESVSDINEKNYKKNLKIEENEKALELLDKEIDNQKEPITSDKSTDAQCVKIKKSIDSLKNNDYLSEVKQKNDKAYEIKTKIDNLKSELYKESLITKNLETVKQIEEEAKDVSIKKAELEKNEMLAEDFVKEWISKVEGKINSKFNFVKFKLYETQINGEEKETCEAYVNGIPFKFLNTANQINAGIDIINTFSKFHGVSAPLFIDRRESVNNLIKTNSQIINLIVTKQPLIIK